MRKLISLIAATLIAVSTGPAGATDAIKCYKLGSWSDQFRLVFQTAVGGHQLVYGRWVAKNDYAVPVSGAYEVDLDGTTKYLSLTGVTHDATLFGDNPVCSLSAVVGGEVTLQCYGGTGSSFHNSTSPLTSISCPATGPTADEGSPTGEPRASQQ